MITTIGFARVRYEITDAGRAALAEHPKCACGAPADGHIWVKADISHWQPACAFAIDEAFDNGAIVSRWPEC